MEIIVDNFAGGGGASTGIELALGRSVDIAINHDPAAIAMHKANHPDTEHYLESVWDVEPREVVKGREVGLCWLSPDCTHFSKAKGGKPLKKEIRGLAWVAVRWAATVRPRVIILENVEEFKTWGPLTKDGLPCPDRKGKTFKSFVNALKRQGYQVDFRELRACDYGSPTSRKRFFMIARCDGRPIVWPKHTHGDPNSQEVKSGKLKPWRTAAEIIDWSKPCPSIFDTSEEIKAKYGLRAIRPLAEKTMKRIALGIQKFVIENPDPFIIPRDNKVLAPLVTSHLIKMKGTNIGQPVDQPLQTITAGGNHFGEVRAFLTHYYGTSIGSKLNDPLPTVVSKDRFGLVVVGGLNYQIADIGMRMLDPRELFNAQGFPSDYIIDRDYKGNMYPKTAQVARCGNSVPPQLAEHLVRANLPELCIGTAVGQLRKVSS